MDIYNIYVIYDKRQVLFSKKQLAFPYRIKVTTRSDYIAIINQYIWWLHQSTIITSCCVRFLMHTCDATLLMDILQDSMIMYAYITDSW